MSINVDNTALWGSISIFKDLREKSSISDSIIKDYIKLPGMIFLKKHLKVHGGLELDESFLRRLIDKIISNPTSSSDDNIFIKSLKRGYTFVEITEEQFNNIDTNEIIKRAINLVNLHLPESFDKDVQVYFLYGIRGTGIVLENEIAIDICDEYVSKNGIIDVNNLIGIIAHELHHIAINKHLFIKQRSEENPNMLRLANFLSDLVSEGLAYYFLPSPYDSDGMISEKWKTNLRNIKNILIEIDNYISRILNGTLVDLKETWHLFNDNLSGYTAGYIMVKLIDESFGKEKLFECIKDCFEFLNQYKQAAEKESYESSVYA